MDFKKMNDRICACVPDLTASTILSRGFCVCDNKRDSPREATMLLTGINPSYDAHKGMWPGRVHPYSFTAVSGPYWSKKKAQFGEVWDEMAYLDLFPIRETDQGLFEKTFRNMISLRRDLLEITQEAIEEMCPKMIVHANRGSMYYWGVDEHNPWMGYKLTPVGINTYPDLPSCMKSFDRMKRFPLYRIDGFVDSPKRINQKSSLKRH